LRAFRKSKLHLLEQVRILFGHGSRFVAHPEILDVLLASPPSQPRVSETAKGMPAHPRFVKQIRKLIGEKLQLGGEGSGGVEVDEMYHGGRRKNKSGECSAATPRTRRWSWELSSARADGSRRGSPHG
jgi:hypothetical protein